ncbi:MAG: type VI secretion system tube protein Hcp [Acidobacteria bacterium]|nr:type VI secretion system tube protein Hcp [Acidobacteriota bacterium]
MPIPASLEIPDIPGSSIIENRADHMEIFGFRHEVYMPTDRKDGSATGTRVHQDFVLIKNYDKGSPKLYEYLCNGKVIPSAKLHWYMIDPAGTETEYFTHELTNARVTSIRPHMPDVDNPGNEQYKHMEEVSMRYEKIKWIWVDGNIEYEDSWTEGR